MKVRMPVHGAVPVSLLLDDRVTFSDLKVYTALASFQGSNDDSYPSRDAIVERCGLVVETVSRSVVHLVELGWIQRDRRGLNKTNVYRVMVDLDPISEVTPRSHPGSDSRVTSEVTPRSHPSIKQKEHLKTTLSSADFALAYLNEKTGSKFRSHKGTGLSTLLSSGTSLETIKAVIDQQAVAWNGTEWAKYLTPSTLFRASNFEKYENALRLPKVAPKKGNKLQFGFETFDPNRQVADEIPM